MGVKRTINNLPASLGAAFERVSVSHTTTGLAGFQFTQPRAAGASATVKCNRNEMRISQRTGIRQVRLVESFAGWARLQLSPNVENPSLNLTFGCRAGKTGYEPVEDNRQVTHPKFMSAWRNVKTLEVKTIKRPCNNRDEDWNTKTVIRIPSVMQSAILPR